MPADVLVVVPDGALREVLEVALRLDGYRVQTAADGVQTLARLLEAPPDLLVLDASTPFAAKVMRWAGRQSVPLLLLLADASMDRPPLDDQPRAVVLPMPFGLAQFRCALATVRGGGRNYRD